MSGSSRRPSSPDDRARRARSWLSRAKEPARIARRRSVVVDRAATVVEHAVVLWRRDPILIFSIGKVGTTALSASIEQATGRPVVKAHGLTRSGLRERLERELLITKRPRGLWENAWLRRDLVLRPRRPWQVISGIRDPIALAASAHFYNVRVRSSSDGGAGRATDMSMADHAREVEAIARRLTHDEDWFRDEMEPVTGIDVYAEPFPHEAGYARFRRGRFDVLLLRQEDLRAVAPEALAEFFGLPRPVEILTRNHGDGDQTYSEFLSHWRFSQEFVDSIYATPVVRHFYSDTERQAMKERWAE